MIFNIAIVTFFKEIYDLNLQFNQILHNKNKFKFRFKDFKCTKIVKRFGTILCLQDVILDGKSPHTLIL